MFPFQVVQSQLGDLAVKKKQRQRESEDEDSRIDRHDLQKEGGGCLPSSPNNQLISSSPRHGRMKTFVVTFTFVPSVSPLSALTVDLNLTFSFRLCNLGTLKRSHTAPGRGGGSEEDGGRVGGEVHHLHKPAAREKALGLGDISSDSSGSGVGDKPSESEEESPRHRVGQVMIRLVQ